jgi:hypothetical protein
VLQRSGRTAQLDAPVTMGPQAAPNPRALTRAKQEATIMGEAFHMGGWGMYPTALFGLMLVAASIRYAMSPERRFVPIQVSLGIVTLASGGLGFVTGMIKSALAIEGAGPDKRWIWVLGMGESLNNLALALALLTVGALAASVGALRLAREVPPSGGKLAA